MVDEVSNDFYVRTTEERHKARFFVAAVFLFGNVHSVKAASEGTNRETCNDQVVARAVWKKCKDKGDIYLDNYEGWCPGLCCFKEIISFIHNHAPSCFLKQQIVTHITCSTFLCQPQSPLLACTTGSGGVAVYGLGVRS